MWESAVDFSKQTPTRAKRLSADKNVAMLKLLSGLSVFAAIIVDTTLVFPKLQNAETGDLSLAGLAEVDWVSFIVVTAVCLAAALILKIAENNKSADKN